MTLCNCLRSLSASAQALLDRKRKPDMKWEILMMLEFDWVGVTQEQLTEQFNKTRPQVEPPTGAGLINAFVEVMRNVR